MDKLGQDHFDNIGEFADTKSLGSLECSAKFLKQYTRPVLRPRWLAFDPIGLSDSEDERSRTYQRRFGNRNRSN